MTRQEAPIVVGSSPSSGSTLLWAVLVRLPGICSGGELAVLDRPHLFDIPAEVLHTDFPRFVKRAAMPFVTGTPSAFYRAAEWGWEYDEMLALGPRSDSWHEVLQRFFAGAVARRGAHRWLEKSPSNVFGYHRTLEAFPDALFVQVVRDGRDVVHSLFGRKFTPFKAVSSWMTAVLAGRRPPSPNECTLRYEDFVTDPAAALASLCAFLGEPYEDSLLAPQPSPDAVVHPSWGASPEQPITPAAVGRYRSGDPELILAHLAAVTLSPAGRELLAAIPGVEDPGEVTALDVLRQAGYEEDGDPRPLTQAERDAVQDEVAAYLALEERVHGRVVYPVPTMLR